MNILIIHEVDWLKKITYEMHHLSEIFSIKDHNVHVIDLPDPGVLSTDKKNFETVLNYHRVYEDSSVIIHRTPTIPIKGLNRIYAYFTSYKFIKKIIIENKIDVLLLYSVVTNAKAAIKASNELGIPIIHRTFDIIHELIREEYLKKRVLKIEKLVYPEFDLVIANTPYMKEWAIDMGSKNTIVVSQGVDPNIMKPLPIDIELQQKLKIKVDENVIMYLGTIESFSGLDIFIKKFPKMLLKNPALKLLVVGDGGHLNEIRKLVKDLDLREKVIFTGYVPYTDVPRYCSLAKLCINTFQINDMTDRLSPVKIFDMLACGKPIVTTKLKGLQYDFPEEKDILIYCEIGKFDEKILELLKDSKLNEIGSKGRKFIESNYSWKKVSETMLHEMEKIVDE